MSLPNKHCVAIIIVLMMVYQFAIAVYMPCTPAIVQTLHTSTSYVQFTLTLYVLGYGISGFIYGPMSDIYGRRPIILFGLSLFAVGSLIALLTKHIEILLICRFLQGFGIGCGDVMGRAILCDLYEQRQFVKAASYIAMAAPIMPLLAPILGGYVAFYVDWRMNFIFMLMLSLLAICIVYKYLTETNKHLLKNDREHTFGKLVKRLLHNGLIIIKNPIFIGFFIPGVAAGLGDLSYNLIAPFIIQTQLGWTSVAYGWLGMLLASGSLMGALISNQLSEKYQPRYMVRLGLSIVVTASILMLIASLSHQINIYTTVIPMMLFTCGIGIIYPNTNAGALTPFAAMAGIAGAIQGGLQTTFVSGLGSLLATIGKQTHTSLAITLTLTTTTAMSIFYLLVYRRRAIQAVKT